MERKQLYRGSSSAYTMKGKEGYDAVLNMQGEGTVTTLSMADCFIEFLKANPEALNHKREQNCLVCYKQAQ